MKKMRNFLTLAAAAALTGILLTGCSTEADETTIAKAETTTQTESAADAEKASEGDVSSAVAAKTAFSSFCHTSFLCLFDANSRGQHIRFRSSHIPPI